MKGFASDNYAGALPQVMQALHAANEDHASSYGIDPISLRVQEMMRELFGLPVDAYFVFNGTGANVLSLSLCTQSYSAVLCADIAHINADESSAPESFTGCRIFPIPTHADGKITVEGLLPRVLRLGDKHYAQPSVVSITQATEYGTCYTLAEIKAIKDFCHQHKLYLHMDGARLLNAVANMHVSLKELVADSGIDILSFGGTKAGMLYGECVVIFNEALKKAAPFKHKQTMQLASKTRFIATQFEALLKEDTGRKAAQHANGMATRLAAGMKNIPGIEITRATQANGVFAILPAALIAPLQERYPFYVWDELRHEIRLMCSWDTTAEEVDAFISYTKSLCTEKETA